MALRVVRGALVAEVPAHNAIGSPMLDATSPITAGIWHHAAYVHHRGGWSNGANHRFYVDGCECADLVFEGNPGTLPFNAPAPTTSGGQQLSVAGRRFQGQMAMLRFSSGMRSTESFEAPFPLSVDGTTLALWEMDEGSGSVAFDSASHGRHAALTGDVVLATGCLP